MGGWELGEEKESSSYFANDLFVKEKEKKTKRISLAYSTAAAAAASLSVQPAVQNIITDTRDDDVRGTSSFFGEGDGRSWVHNV